MRQLRKQNLGVGVGIKPTLHDAQRNRSRTQHAARSLDAI
jgi:hypothetical protein